LYRLLPAEGWKSHLLAAIATLPSAVASHESAATIHRIDRIRSPVAAVTVHSRTTHVFPEVVVRRAHDLVPEHVEDNEGVPVTTLPRTVVDLAGILGPSHIGDIIDDLVLEGRITVETIADTLAVVARHGKPGVAKLRSVLAERSDAPTPMSRLERRGLDIVEALPIPQPVREYPIPWTPHRRFDLAWPDANLAVEWDSRRWHGSLRQMGEDRARDRGAIIHGWAVLRYTWEDVRTRSFDVGHEIAEIVITRLESAHSAG